MTSPKSGSGAVGVTGPVVAHGGTAGHLPAGYALHEFQIERVLGEGGFSVVYLATDTRLERQVAIKEYMPTALATRSPDLSVQVRASAQHREAFDAGLRSFINEAKLLARFEHRALVKVHQFWQEMGTAYMVMPYYSGPTLKSWIRQQHEPVDATWLEQFLRLLMDALETLHRENCLHRDVAPDNILILNERTPLLLDFGAARRVIGDLTQALTVILKPGFAPIEQYAESQSMRQGPWTDVYALCAVAHFMITGRAPTPAVTRVLADDLVPLSAAAAGRFPPAFLAALDAGLTVRPQQRPQSIAALRELMNGTAPEDNTLTAPPGRAVPLMGAPVPTTIAPAPATIGPAPAEAGPAPTTIQPLTPTISPDAAPPVDDDRTRIVTTRDALLRTSPATISSPTQPAATAEPSATEPVETLASSPVEFGTRLPSRSMREHDPVTAGAAMRTDREDRVPLLPFLIGGVAIAAVIGGAWALINWMNSDFDALRKRAPVSTPAPAPNPAPAPVQKAAAPESTSKAAAQMPAPAPTVAAPPPAAASQSTSPASNVGSAESTTGSASTRTPSPKPPAATAPATTLAAATTAPDTAGAANKVSVEKGPTTPSTSSAKPDRDTPARGPTPAPATASGSPPTTKTAAKSEPKVERTATAAASLPPPQNTSAASPPAHTAAKGAPAAATNARPATAQTAANSKARSPANGDGARARPTMAPPSQAATPPAPAYEPPAAPSVSVPRVATVEAGLPPPVAAVEPPRQATPPTAAAAPAPLRALSRPDPMFPREAIRADVDKGTVRARLFVAPDGTVSKVEILSAQPARVFDREVRETTRRWRFDPPGQPRQTDVEFVFDRYKDR